MSGYDGEGQDHGTADPLEHERTWLEMLWFCTKRYMGCECWCHELTGAPA